jgi:hypothetical protein
MSKNDDKRIGLCPCPRTMTNSTNSEVIFKFVKQMHPWGDERIKKIVDALPVERIKISIPSDIWYSYSYV